MNSIFSLRGGLYIRPAFLSMLILCCCNATAFGQTNSWTNVASGNWEDPHWSLGVLPGTNQTILLTNAGFKAVESVPARCSLIPQTLRRRGSAPLRPRRTPFNTLLLNYAGNAAHPLVDWRHRILTGALIVNSNSAVTVLSSALQVRNVDYQWRQSAAAHFPLAATFTEDDSSQVTAGFVNLGRHWTRRITTSPTAARSPPTRKMWRTSPAVFNQQGGTNTTAGFPDIGRRV